MKENKYYAPSNRRPCDIPDEDLRDLLRVFSAVRRSKAFLMFMKTQFNLSASGVRNRIARAKKRKVGKK